MRDRSHLMFGDSSSGRGLLGLFLGALASTAAPPVTAAAVPEQRFVVQGTASATASGPGCCGSTVFRGPAQVAYSIDGAGQVTLTRVEMDVNDVDVPIRGIFDIVVGHAHLRCANFSDLGQAVGRVDTPGRLKLAPGAVRLFGSSFEERLGDASCVTPNFAVTATNNVEVVLEHDPTADRFRLSGGFRASHDGETYNVALNVEASYLNRPPDARVVVAYPGKEQGDCPDQFHPQLGLVAEANDPAGFRADVRSSSIDPDGAWARADIQAERWFQGRSGGPEVLVGSGRSLGSVLFEFGPLHALSLLVSDRTGASDEDGCKFIVVDTRPPSVVPPKEESVECTVPGGATPGTSSPLSTFLASATAVDASDPSPVMLTPLVAGVPVTGTTFFPLDLTLGGAGTPVTFRARDRFGNEGRADSRVHVVDTTVPVGTLALTPSVIPPNKKFYVIAATISTSDVCGPVEVRLEAIKSNAPELDPIDIGGAAFGTDDRGFYVRARQAAPGVPRVYRVYYTLRDPSGNVQWLESTITVRGGVAR